MNFEAALRDLVGGTANIGVEHTVGGVIRVTISNLVDYRALDDVLRAHDKTLALTADGQIELHPLVDNIRCAGDVNIGAQSTTVVRSGAINEVTRTMPTATSADLTAIAAMPNVLNVAIASGVVVVNEIIPSDLRDGLAHLKFKGSLHTTRARKTKTTWPKKSRALKRARAARQRKAWW